MNAPDNGEYGDITQDDYDTWVGEAALVRWGEGKYGDQGWIRYNRHGKGANYVYTRTATPNFFRGAKRGAISFPITLSGNH